MIYRNITLINVSRFEPDILVNGLVYTWPRSCHPLSVALIPCAIAWAHGVDQHDAGGSFGDRDGSDMTSLVYQWYEILVCTIDMSDFARRTAAVHVMVVTSAVRHRTQFERQYSFSDSYDPNFHKVRGEHFCTNVSS